MEIGFGGSIISSGIVLAGYGLIDPGARRESTNLNGVVPSINGFDRCMPTFAAVCTGPNRSDAQRNVLDAPGPFCRSTHIGSCFGGTSSRGEAFHAQKGSNCGDGLWHELQSNVDQQKVGLLSWMIQLFTNTFESVGKASVVTDIAPVNWVYRTVKTFFVLISLFCQ